MPWLSLQGKHLWYVISRPVKRASLRCRSAIRQFKERLLRFPAAQLLVRTVRELGHDDASHMAAAISYYGILSLFPLLLGLIAILGLFLPSQTVQQELLDFFRRNLPGSIQLLEDNIHGVIRLRGTLGLLSLLGLLWTGHTTAGSVYGAIWYAISRFLYEWVRFFLQSLRSQFHIRSRKYVRRWFFVNNKVQIKQKS